MHRIKVGPPIVTIHQGNSFMVTTAEAEITPDAELGVFAQDTRLISLYKLWIDRERWTLASSAPVSYFGAVYVFLSPKIAAPDGTPEPGKVQLRLERTMSGGGIHEDFDITNYFQGEVSFDFAIEVQSDFADIFEVKRHQIPARECETSWNAKASQWHAHYSREDFERSLIYRVQKADSKPHFANGKIHFRIRLAPAGVWRLCSEIIPVIGGRQRRPHVGYRQAAIGDHKTQEKDRQWHDRVSRIKTSNVTVRKSFEQSAYDIGALRIDISDEEGLLSWMPAAGVPWFVTIFGRDSLTVALQAMIVNPHLARGTLAHLAKYQAKERDDWRDAQPGKILHEMRFGELAHFKETPHGPYYGTADASILYLIALSEAYRWIGDEGLLEKHWNTALHCLEWIDRYGDLDGDGFQEYKTFSSQGYHNMAWKDSGVALVYPDGSQVQQPIAICELQGYVYDAKLRMAELYELEGEAVRAKKLRSQAQALKKDFNEAFWMEDEGAYAFALDPDKKQVRTIASNPGQLLWTGIVDGRAKAERLIQRLLQPDMYSGWGIRTLSKSNPAYDPNAYQLGSVWPHDNAIIAAGAKRYGLWQEANTIGEASSTPPKNSRCSGFPSFSAARTAKRKGFRCNTFGRTSLRPGPLAPFSCFYAPFSASKPTRTRTSSTSIPPCPIGFQSSRLPGCVWEISGLRSVSPGKAPPPVMTFWKAATR
jgi:glycogen debranching enzyme